MSIRKITNTGTKKVIGKFPSLKMGEAVWWESQLERDYIYLLEADQDVVSFEAQPFKIAYLKDGKERRYTPDFLVVRKKGKRQVVEVKPEDKLCSARNKDIFQFVPGVCRNNNLEFIVVTDKEIRLQPRLDNVKLLHRYSRVQIDPELLYKIKDYFEVNGPSKLGEAAISQKGVNKEHILALIYSGALETDIMAAIGDSSIVSLVKE